jgi:hypothetical protein
MIFLTACSGLNDAGKVLRNEKKNTTDEFLVKKKEPLTMPPNYNEIPEPNSLKNKNIKQEEKFKKILNSQKKEQLNNNKSSSTEDAILNRIRK